MKIKNDNLSKTPLDVGTAEERMSSNVTCSCIPSRRQK
jgi:hypothetical protein